MNEEFIFVASCMAFFALCFAAVWTLIEYPRTVMIGAVGLLLSGCVLTDWLRNTGDAAEDLLLLRVTWEKPARQAGVYDEAQAQIKRLDDAIASGDPQRVRGVLLSFEPVYREIYASVDNPTPEQQRFHARVMSLWEYVNQPDDNKWLELARLVVRVLATRV